MKSFSPKKCDLFIAEMAGQPSSGVADCRGGWDGDMTAGPTDCRTFEAKVRDERALLAELSAPGVVVSTTFGRFFTGRFFRFKILSARLRSMGTIAAEGSRTTKMRRLAWAHGGHVG